MSALAKILARGPDPEADEVPGKTETPLWHTRTSKTKEPTEKNVTTDRKNNSERNDKPSPNISGGEGLGMGAPTVKNQTTDASISTTLEKRDTSSANSSPEATRLLTKKSVNASSCAPTATGKDTTPSANSQVITSLPQALDAINAFLLKYIRFPEEWHSHIVALWSVYSWTWRAFYCTPYLMSRGPEQNCGKTQVLRCLLALCDNVLGDAIVVSISEAALYRSIHADQPVLLIDEVDKFFANGTQDPMVGVLNSGYQYGAIAIRCIGQSNKPEKFGTFCPKAFAGIGNMVDETTASRAIHIHMARQDPGNRAATFRPREIPGEVAHIRLFLAIWAKEAFEVLHRARPLVPEEITDGRQIDIVEPLLAVADIAGEEWAAKAREAVVYAFSQPVEDSEGTQLLRSIRAVFETITASKITSYDLIGKLIAEESDVPWATKWERDYSAGRWHGAAGWIARTLKRYGIEPKNMRNDADEVHKGYVQGDFAKAWAKYLPKEIQREQAQLL